MKHAIKNFFSKTDKASLAENAMFTIVCVIWRFIPHLPNVTPLNANALLSGKRSSPWASLIFPLIPLVIGDLVWGFHRTIFFVYGAILIIAQLGKWINQSSYKTLVLGSISSSIIFFFITNIGSWLTSGMYPLSSAGLLKALVLGIPFLNYAICGDLFFTLVFYAISHYRVQKTNFSNASTREIRSALH